MEQHQVRHHKKHQAQWPSSKWWTSWKVAQKGQSQTSRCSTALQTRALYHRERHRPNRLLKRRTSTNTKINMLNKLINLINNWLFLNNKNSLRRIWLKLLSWQMLHLKRSSHSNLLLWIKPSFPRSQASLATPEFLQWEALTIQRICIRSNRRSKTKSTLWSRRLQDKLTTQAQQWLLCHHKSTRQGKVSLPKQLATVVLQTTPKVHPETVPRFWYHKIATFHIHNNITRAYHLLVEDPQLLITQMKMTK